MSARDTFEWFVTTQAGGMAPDLAAFIREQRQYLFTLRSEDERQRFVEWAIVELTRRARADGHPPRPAKQPAGAVGK
jgi:hypothetical protein